MFTVEKLSVRYGQATAVNDVSLNVGQGEVVAVLGANGAGKTSLGQAIAGIVKASGEITLRDSDVAAMSSGARVKDGVVYVPEGRHVFTQLTVEDNLRAGAFVRRRDGDWRTHRDQMYDRVPRLAERAKMRAGLLSGGEQQLLALCRAMMARPQLLILDEPSLGLAPMAIDTIASFLLELCEEGSLSVLLLEQNIAFATRLAQRAYIMRLGEVHSEVSRDVLADTERVRSVLTDAAAPTDR